MSYGFTFAWPTRWFEGYVASVTNSATYGIRFRVFFNPADGWPSRAWMRWPSDYLDGFVGFRGFRHPEEDDFPL